MIEDEQRVQLPRLLQKALSGNTFLEEARLHPGKLSPTLRMQPLSTATMILPESDPDIVMHDLVELYNQHGSCGIFRVVDIQPAYGKNRTITLNHALDVLNDAVYPSNTEEFNGTVTAYLTKLLGAQKQKIGNTPYWQLGTVEDTGTWHQEFNYDNILDLIKEITSEHEDYYFTFDFSVFPWRLNLVVRNDDVLTEFRASRNIASCKVTQSDKDQCTRLHLSITTKTTVTEQGRTAGKKSTTTFETHDDPTGQAAWGIIEKTAGIETDKVPAAEKAAWVQGYFDRHRDPNVQISISGYDLKEQTGEDIDEMHLARVCRAVLPRYNTTLLERIVEVTYPDALGQPTKVDVSMANKRQTTEDNIASAQKEAKKAGGSGGKAKQKADNNETEIERQKIIYNVDVTKTNEYFRVLATESEWDDLKQAYETSSEGLLNVTARNIAGAVGRIDIVEGKVSTIEGSTVWINRENVAAVTGKMSVDSNGDLVVNDGSGLYVSRNGSKLGVWDSGNLTAGIVIGKITDSNGKLSTSITIDADNVYIGSEKSTTVIAGKASLDDVTADYISGKIATLSVLNVASISATGNISTSNGYIMAPYIYLGSVGTANNLANSIYALRIDLSGDTYTLKKQSFGNSSWVDVGTFSRATALSGAWSSGKFTVNASPQGESYWTELVQGATSWNGKTATVPVNAIDTTSGGNAYATGRNITVDASSVYTNGYNDGKPTSGTAGSRHGSGYSWDFVITKGDATTATLTIDCTSVYTDARSGYTKGTFTQATVTPQGNSDSVFIEASSGGYDYYQADSNATYYQAGTEESYYDGNGGEFTVQGETETVYPGNGTSGYLRGSTVTVTKQGSSVTVYPRGTVHYYIRHAKTDTPTGAWYERTTSKPSGVTYNTEYGDGGSATYYNAGSDVTYYKGDGSYVYGRGTAMTRYKAGTVTKHDRGNAVTVTPVGASVTVTPIKTSTKKHLLATTRYKAGTPDSSTYYTKS